MTRKTVYVAGKRVRLDPATMLGQGGEAEVFGISHGRALKLFKGPKHPEYAGCSEAQAAAKKRLSLIQTKLPAFPRQLPDVVIKPQELVTDRKGTTILGYTMARIDHAQPLHSYTTKAIRKQGIDDCRVTQLLLDLHDAIVDVHASGAVIGDLNDLNVLVGRRSIAVIDADSFQYAGYPCPVITQRFLDPLRCQLQGQQWVPIAPASSLSDWYAFAVMAMQCLLWVGPYGGIFRPKDPSRRVPASLRPSRRLTVFAAEVRYPRPARHWSVLPGALQDMFRRWFVDDQRGVFPRELLANLVWISCPSCGAEHARKVCPTCVPQVAAAPPSLPSTPQEVVARIRLRGRGLVVHAQVTSGVLRFVVHNNGRFCREDGHEVGRGELGFGMAFALTENATWVGVRGRWVCLDGSQPSHGVIAGNFGPGLVCLQEHVYTCQSAGLYRQDPVGPTFVGPVVDGQTSLWVGAVRGLGMYRVGGLRGVFSFTHGRVGVREVTGIRAFRGHLLQAHATFGQANTWLFTAWATASGVVHRCELIGGDGVVIAYAQAPAGDGSWLGSLGGQAAVADVLFAPTDAGLVRVVSNHGLCVDRTFPETAPWVDGATVLKISQEGLHAVNPREIIDLQLQPKRPARQV